MKLFAHLSLGLFGTATNVRLWKEQTEGKFANRNTFWWFLNGDNYVDAHRRIGR